MILPAVVISIIIGMLLFNLMDAFPVKIKRKNKYK